MTTKSYKICQNCNKVNLNRNYCKQCGEILDITLKRKLERDKALILENKIEETQQKKSLTLFFENAKQHKNLFVRLIARVFYSVWVVVIVVGSVLALLMMYIAA